MQLAEKLRSNFARNLAKLRTERALTQAGLVEALNTKYDIQLKRTTIANYEAQEAMPKIDALYCIADFFGQTIDQIIGGPAEKTILLHPWMLKDTKPVEDLPDPGHEGPPDTEKPALEESRKRLFDKMPDLDTLISEYVEGIAVRQFYVEFTRSLLRQLQENATQLDEPEKIKRLFSRTYLNSLISKSKFFQEQLENILLKNEYEVFRGFQEGSTVRMLSEALQLTEDEVIQTFQNAKTKVLSAIDQVQNE